MARPNLQRKTLSLDLGHSVQPEKRTLKLSKKLDLSLEKSIVQDDVPVEIEQGLYLGSIHASFNQHALQERNITHILNVSGLPASYPQNFTYLTINLRDREYSNLLACIPTSNVFIEAGLKAGGVLVHCNGGKSRSPALIIAFLVSKRGISVEEAMKILKDKRPVVDPNQGFVLQLHAYINAGCDAIEAHQRLLRERMKIMLAKQKEGFTNIQNLIAPVRNPIHAQLKRPGSPAVTVRTPLSGYNLEFKCSACRQRALFAAGNIVCHDKQDDQDLLNTEVGMRILQIQSQEISYFDQESPHVCHRSSLSLDQVNLERVANIMVPQSCRSKKSRGIWNEASLAIDMQEYTEIVDVFDDSTPPTTRRASSMKGRSSRNRWNEIGETQLSNKNVFDFEVKERHHANLESKLESIVELQSPVDASSSCSSTRSLSRTQSVAESRFLDYNFDQITQRPSTREMQQWLDEMNSLPGIERAIPAKCQRSHIDSLSTFSPLSSINFDLANGSSCEYCFLEPMDWMGDISSAQGTLYCPNEDCKAVLGDWCWEGDQCSCGFSVAPSFRIVVSSLMAFQRPQSRSSSRASRSNLSHLHEAKIDSTKPFTPRTLNRAQSDGI